MASLPSGPGVVHVGMDTTVREIVCGVLRPGTEVPAVERIPNDEESVRRLIGKLGDRRLGFDDGELKEMLASAGLSDVTVGVGARKSGDPFTVLIASGIKKTAHHEAAKITKTTKTTKTTTS